MACARTVAVVVPSPASSLVLEATSLTICAPMFSNLFSSSISLATVTPSLVIKGAPKDFSITTLRPFGPRVTFTAFARTFTPRRMALRASSLKRNSLLIVCFLFKLKKFLVHDSENIFFFHHQILFTVEFEFGARIFSEEDLVADFD